MRQRPSIKPSGLTRRSLFRAGGVAGAAAIVGGRALGVSPAFAATADDGTPGYLLRSSYNWLKTNEFTVGGAASIDLVAVADLPAATAVKELAGSEDAFMLTFAGGTLLESGTHTLDNPELGRFELFLVPDDAGGGSYSATVNRSVGALQHLPKPPKQGDPRPGANPKTGRSATRLARIRRRRFIRKMRARRTAKGIACAVVLGPEVKAKTVTVWLTRGKRTVASGVGKVHGDKAVVRARTGRRLRAGRYELAVIAHEHDGGQHGRVERVTLN
jgi:hypothetical protein